MLARCVIIRVHLSQSRRCTSIDPPTNTYQHNTYYLVEYGESNLAISPMCSRERFSFYKFSSYAYPCERIGPLATPQLPCLLCLSFTFLLLKPKTPKYLPLSVCSLSLSSVIYQHLLLLVGSTSLFIEKLQLISYTCGLSRIVYWRG